MAKLAPETERLASPVAPKGMHGKGLAQDGLSPFTKGNSPTCISRISSYVDSVLGSGLVWRGVCYNSVAAK